MEESVQFMKEEQKNNRNKKARKATKNHMIWAMGAGLIPVPVADFFAVSAVQLDLVRRLCKIYDVEFKETEGKALITALTGSGIARLGARAVKFIPGVGSVVGGLTMSVLSGASTYALGEVFTKHFETGGTFLDFDPERLRKYYDKKFEKGKKMARKMKEEQEEDRDIPHESPFTATSKSGSSAELVEQLEKIADLHEKGVLDDEEFARMKKKIIDAMD